MVKNVEKYYIIKPMDFVIPQESIVFHGITNDIANTEGVDILPVLENSTKAYLRLTKLLDTIFRLILGW